MNDVLDKMRDDWHQRASEDARRYITSPGFAAEKYGFAISGLDDCYHLLSNIYPRLHADMTVLEIGCGIGRLLQYMARIFARVRGVDIAPGMVAQARDYLHGIPNVEIALGDGHSLPFPDASIDFVYSHAVFQHIPSLAVIRDYVAETKRVLRPGGLCKLMVKTQAWQDEPDTKDSWFGVNVTRTNIDGWCEELGFELVSAEDIDGHVGWMVLGDRT